MMKSVLVVEDSDEFRAMLCDVFVDAGYRVLEASNGAEALRIYRDNPEAVIVLDILLPVKEGIRTIFELRREFPNVKIVAISGGGLLDPEVCLHMAKSAGAQHTLRKPFELNSILTIVEQLSIEG